MKQILLIVLIVTILSSCENKSENILSDFYGQVEGEWMSEDVKINGGVNSSAGVMKKIKIKFSPCSQSPCNLDFSFEQNKYTNLSYNRGIGTSGTSLESKVILSMNPTLDFDNMSENEKYFFLNMQTIFIQEYNKSRLKIEIPLQGGPIYNATFTRL